MLVLDVMASARMALTYQQHPVLISISVVWCVFLLHPTGPTGLRPAGIYPTDGREDQNQVDQPRGERRLLRVKR